MIRGYQFGSAGGSDFNLTRRAFGLEVWFDFPFYDVRKSLISMCAILGVTPRDTESKYQSSRAVSEPFKKSKKPQKIPSRKTVKKRANVHPAFVNLWVVLTLAVIVWGVLDLTGGWCLWTRFTITNLNIWLVMEPSKTDDATYRFCPVTVTGTEEKTRRRWLRGNALFNLTIGPVCCELSGSTTSGVDIRPARFCDTRRALHILIRIADGGLGLLLISDRWSTGNATKARRHKTGDLEGRRAT
jgi:hypothetical protein